MANNHILQPKPLSNSRPDRRPLNPPARRPRLPPLPEVTVKRPIPEQVSERTLWQSFRSLTPNLRITVGIALGVVGFAGIVWDRTVLQDGGKKDKAQSSPVRFEVVDRPAK